MGPQSLGNFNHTFNMGLVEEVEDSIVVENEGGTRETESNFVDVGKSPCISYPKSSNSSFGKSFWPLVKFGKHLARKCDFLSTQVSY